jgi:hypothetical protein
MSSIIGSLPFTLTNGQTADATQVMADFNEIVSSVNANAVPTSDLPVSVANGGTGLSTGFMPPGTVVGAFLQAAAPTGWTQNNTFNDQVIRPVNAGSGFVGGATGGSWAISGVTIGGTALTQAQLPNFNCTVTEPNAGQGHEHTIPNIGNTAQAVNTAGAVFVSAAGTLTTNFSTTGITVSTGGGGQTHAHGFANDSTWRPAFVNSVVATKN